MSLFSRKKKVVINYVDLDEDKKIITSTGEIIGKAGKAVDYSSADELEKLADQGYKLSYNEYDPTGSAPAFSNESLYTYTISLKHDTEELDHADANLGITKNDLERVGKQVVHYKSAATRTPQDNVSYVTFKRNVMIDKVTKKIVDSLDWQPEKQTYLMVTTPEIPGYITEDPVVGGETVTLDDCDREYTVEYEINQQPSTEDQTVKVEYVDHDDENQEIVTDTLTGQANMLVDYDPKNTIEKLEKQGYTLVDNGYNPVGEVQFYSNNDDYVPTYIMTMKHTIGPVDVDHPNDKVEKAEYLREVEFAVNYEGAGSATSNNNV